MSTNAKVKLIGFAIVVIGGAVAYLTRGSLSTEGADKTVFIGGVVVGLLGFVMLIGINGLKLIGRGIYSAGANQPKVKL
jgi:hypothetical protein